tara:strand:+ start:3766 stop:5622 length:1857 start_codon:yes stop_codon:yes gene_type:complete
VEKNEKRSLIQIIDDDLKNLQVAGKSLEKKGHRVSLSQSGREALEIAALIKPDLILLDVMMPEMNGFDVCQKIKSNPELQHIPIIFITLKTEPHDIVKCFEMGGVDFIAKPLNEPEFLARVQNHLDIKNTKEKLINQRQETMTLLENLGQGFMIFDKEGFVKPGSTKVVKKFFGHEPTGKNLADIFELNSDERNRFKKWCQNVWSGKISFKDLVSLAPQTYVKNNKSYFTLEYRPIYKPNEKRVIIESVICIASDKTKEWELKKKALKEEEKGITYNLIITNTIEFLDLMMDAVDSFWNIQLYLEKEKNRIHLEEVFRKIHTIKARFAYFKMSDFVKKAHEFENYLANLMEKESLDEKDWSLCLGYLKSLKKELEDFQTENKNLLELANKVFFLDEGNFRTVKIETVTSFFEKELGENSEHFINYKNKFLLGSLNLRFKGFSSLIKQLSGTQGKETQFLVSESSVVVNQEAYGPFIASCVHIFRNAIDHGIESVEERISKNKSPAGLIKVDISKSNDNEIKILIKDDGRGIDPGKLKKVVKKSSSELEKKFSKVKDEDYIQVIFKQGFSTKDNVDEVSGRGIGLEAVKNEVKKLKGTIRVLSKIEEGTTFVIFLPIYL